MGGLLRAGFRPCRARAESCTGAMTPITALRQESSLLLDMARRLTTVAAAPRTRPIAQESARVGNGASEHRDHRVHPARYSRRTPAIHCCHAPTDHPVAT